MPALRELIAGRTTPIIAHRLSTVIDADVMLVIKDGTIVKQGAPRELLKNKDRKFYLCDRPFSPTIEHPSSGISPSLRPHRKSDTAR